MTVSFDGPNKLIVTDAATSVVASTELYSRWKDWVATGDNGKYLPAFAVVGGEPLGGGVSVTPYVFLQNGWKVQPLITSAFEITGNLLPESGQSVFSFAAGVRPETVRTMALKSETVATSGGGGEFPTTGQIAAAVKATMEAAGAMLEELHRLQGLQAAAPMTVTPTSRVAGDIELALTGNGQTSTTVTRV